jgi:hypothetical protein
MRAAVQPVNTSGRVDIPLILPVVSHRGKQLRRDVHSPTPPIGRILYEVQHRRGVWASPDVRSND